MTLPQVHLFIIAPFAIVTTTGLIIGLRWAIRKRVQDAMREARLL